MTSVTRRTPGSGRCGTGWSFRMHGSRPGALTRSVTASRSRCASDDKAMKLAWVTGARGVIGRHVARHLSTEGWRVIGIGHGEWRAEAAKAWGIATWRRAEAAVAEPRALAAGIGPP